MGYLKNKIKAKIIKIISPIILNIILIAVVVGVVMGTVEAISSWWNNVTSTVSSSWDSFTDFVTGAEGKRKAALDLYDDLGLEYEGVIYKKNILEKFIDGPYKVNNDDITDRTITVEKKEHIEYVYDDREEYDTDYPHTNIYLSYNEQKKYLVDWQILYAVNYLIDTFELKSLEDADIEELYDQNQLGKDDKEDKIKFIKTSKRRIDKVLNQLKTIITYEYTYDKSFYPFSELYSMPVYKETFFSRYYNPDYPPPEDSEDEEFKYVNYSETKLIPKVAPSTVKTCLFEYQYQYEYRSINQIGNGEPNYRLKNIVIKQNIDTIVNVLQEYDFDESLVELLILIVERLPDGEYIAQDMRSALFEYYKGHSSTSFTPNIPYIEGAWTRQDLINTAKSLQGLHYFWGGKYAKYGASSDWGSIKKVTSAGSMNTGKFIPYGLDCSGFVEWAYYQMLGYSVSKHGGSVSLWHESYSVSRKELLPGDMGFYQYGGGQHVGLYIGKIQGTDAFIHAGGSRWGDSEHPYGQVIVTLQNKNYNGYRSSKFQYFRRLPIKFSDDDFWKESNE